MTLSNVFNPLSDSLRTNQPLSQFTYMRVGGPADYLAVAQSISELTDLVNIAHKNKLRYMVLGGGSNIIFSDAGFRGLVIINRASRCLVDTANLSITVDSGVLTNMLVNESLRSGLSGLEPFLGIPGSVGGALFNNSHYMNEFIGTYVKTVELLDGNGNIRTETRTYLDFSYDHSILQQTHEVVLQATFSLNPEVLLSPAN
jgi:UDP-N-acetylmuramate dehydrogenase